MEHYVEHSDSSYFAHRALELIWKEKFNLSSILIPMLYVQNTRNSNALCNAPCNATNALCSVRSNVQCNVHLDHRLRDIAPPVSLPMSSAKKQVADGTFKWLVTLTEPLHAEGFMHHLTLVENQINKWFKNSKSCISVKMKLILSVK